MTVENGDYTEHEIAHISYEELYQNGEKKSAEELAELEKDNIDEWEVLASHIFLLTYWSINYKLKLKKGL